MQKDPIREAVWQMVNETATHAKLAGRIKRRFGWAGSDRAALSRLSMMLSPRHPHHFPADALADAIAVTGLDYVTPVLLRVALRKRTRKPAKRAGEATNNRRNGMGAA